MRLVLVGGSFAGLEMLHQLRRSDFTSITLVDRRPEHVYVPLIHEAAGKRLSERELFNPYAGWVQRRFGAEYIQGELTRIEPGRAILGDGRELAFDALVLAIGSVHRLSDVRREGAVAHVSAMKWAEDLTTFRNALKLGGKSPRRITVIGDGLTGVEHAAELGYLIKTQKLDSEVKLVGRAELPLAYMAMKHRVTADRALRALGVLRSTENIAAPPAEPGPSDGAEELRVWATGTSPVGGVDGAPRTEAGFIPVNRQLRVALPGHVFAMGDVAQLRDEANQVIPTTMRASEAIFQGRWLGQHLLRLCRDEPVAPYPAQPDFPFYGVSLGPRAIFAYRALGNHSLAGAAFRRTLMWSYFTRLGR